MTGAKDLPGGIRYTTKWPAYGRLRLALFDAWDGQCYWCTAFHQDATAIEIDHILPQRGFEAARKAFGVGSDFALHGVKNLAPVCSSGARCNQRKGNAVDSAAGSIAAALVRADEKARRVIASVNRMQRAKGLESKIVDLLSVDIQEAERAFALYGGQIAQRLAAVRADLPEQYVTQLALDPDIPLPSLPHDAPFASGGSDRIDLPLDHRGRAAVHAVGAVMGVEIKPIIEEAIELVFEQFSERARNEGTKERETDGHFSCEGVTIRLKPLVADFNGDGTAGLLVEGRISGVFFGSFVVSSEEGLRDGQTYVHAEGSFDISIGLTAASEEYELAVDLGPLEVEGDSTIE